MSLHRPTPANEALARQVVELALARRREPPPLQAPEAGDDLTGVLASALTPQGVGGGAALQLFRDRIVPATLPIDHPGFLAFVPQAPSEAAILGDWLVSAFPVFAGAWEGGAGVIAAENAALGWLAAAAGLPEGAGGTFMPGATIGTLSALHVARQRARERGRATGVRAAIAGSAEAHASVAAAARVMDVDWIELPTGADFVLTGAAVRDALRREGDRVCAVVASAGTTNLGIVDDLPGIAAACRAAGTWLHVDAAYGGAVLASPRERHRLAGIESADSLVIDPHKGLFTPYDSCALLYRDPAQAAAVLGLRSEYLDPVHDGARDPFSHGIQLSRRGRGLPLWFSLATCGTDAYARAVEAALDLARDVAREVRARPELELVAEPMLSVVAFARRGWGLPALHEWSARNLRDGLAWIAPSSVRGTPVLRLCIVNPRASLAHICAVLDTLRAP